MNVFTPLKTPLMSSRIKGNNDGPNGRNESYTYKGKTYTRTQMVKRVEQGLHQENTVVTIKGKKYVKDKPDQSKKDNVNRTSK